jgi:hypothetical protein
VFGLLQGLIDAINGAFGGLFSSNGYSELMPGSSFHAVTAAFATQGYWVHADMLNFVGAGEFQRFAVFIYMIALISGMVGMAMGSPPKMYVWFFMGPVLFHFLLGTTSPVMGTAWKVAGVPQEQQEVWKLAEVGLKTMNITEREGLVVNGFSPPSGGVNGNGTVNVSFAFAELDGVVSDTIQEIIKWLGVYKGQSVGSTSGASSTGTGNDTGGRWHLLSNLKWGMLDTIAQARLSSPELRDSFITFMASSCGDRFQNGIDSSRYMAASQSINGTIPPGIFTSGVPTEQYQTDLNKTYSEFNIKLNGTIPTPLAIRRLLYATKGINNKEISQPGSFRNALLAADGVGEEVKFFKGFTAGGTGPIPITVNMVTLDELLQSSGQIQCQHLLDIIVRGFRWEAAGVYTQLVRQLPVGVENPDEFDNAFLNGWDVRKYPKETLFPATAGAKSWKQIIAEDKNPPKVETPEARRQFMINLILINMFKNEFLLAPNAAARKLRFTSAQSAQNAIEMYQKTVGSRNKFGEIYSWALMMPYLQGLLLYLLALGYPFACAVMLLPKCSRIIFTWASFWVWAKLWDLGFAIVVLVERSVWATIGNSSKATQLNPFIAQMLDFGTTVWQGAGAGAKIPDATKLALVGFKDPANLKLSMNSYAFLDRCMTLFSNMDLDLQNSYYIYIMAALYFAVPMMTGQLVLGAKASLAGSITQAFQGMANEVGQRAGRALTQQMSRQAEAANQAVDQALYAKNLQNSGLLARALNAQNEGARADLYQRALQENAQGLGNQERMLSNGFQARQTDSRYGFEFATSMLSNPGNTASSLVMLGTANAAGAADFFLPVPKPGQATPPKSGAPAQGGTLASDAASPSPNSTVSPGAPTSNGSGTVGAFTSGTSGSGQGGPTTGASVTGASSQQGQGSGPITGSAKSVFGDKINTLTGALMGGVGGGVDMAGKYWGYQLQRDSLDQTTAIAAQRGDIGVASFYQGGESQRLGRESQYLMNEAKGTAQDNAWFEKNSYAQGMAAELGSLDVNLPQIGAKSTDDSYLARSGLAGKEAQVESFFFSNSGPDKLQAMGSSSDYEARRFSTGLDQYRSTLQSAFGTTSLLQMYNGQVTNGSNELRLGINAMGGFVNQTMGEVGKNIKDIAELAKDPLKAGNVMSQVADPFRSLMNLTSGNTPSGGSSQPGGSTQPGSSSASYGGGRASLPSNAGFMTEVTGANGQKEKKQQTMLEKR